MVWGADDLSTLMIVIQTLWGVRGHIQESDAASLRMFRLRGLDKARVAPSKNQRDPRQVRQARLGFETIIQKPFILLEQLPASSSHSSIFQPLPASSSHIFSLFSLLCDEGQLLLLAFILLRCGRHGVCGQVESADVRNHWLLHPLAPAHERSNQCNITLCNYMI